MNLFIGNPTKQIQEFAYRIPGNSGVLRQIIPIGGQIKISAELNRPEVDGIIAQHARYGMKSIDEVDRAKPLVALIYSVDKPIPSGRLTQAMAHNDDVLRQNGEEMRKEIAVAANNQIENQLAEIGNDNGQDMTLRGFETSVVEDVRSGQTRVEGQEQFAEGVRVTRGPAAPAKPGGRGKRGR